MRRFAIVGHKAAADGTFLLDDLPGTSGRLDVLVRSIRAALLVSHEIRRDVVVYLVLLGGPRAPRTLRIDGATAKFLRPDERSLAVLVQKSLALAVDDAPGFVDIKTGIAIAARGIEAVLDDAAAATLYVLDEQGADVRDTAAVGQAEGLFIVGDHVGFDDATRAALEGAHATPISVGPRSLHSEDAIAILSNELDRRLA